MNSIRFCKQPAFIFGLLSFLFIQGCDVSSGGGGDTQKPDPVVADFPIAYIERPIPRDEDGLFIADDILDITAFHPGARLYLKDRASVPADAVLITDIAFMPEAVESAEPADGAAPATVEEPIAPLYDVKDLTSNPEGTKLLFSMRAPEIEGADETEQPTWNIWEYDLETEILRRVIESDTIAESGQDIMPAYLADGRIVFSSNRQRRSRAVLLDEGKPQFSALIEDDDREGDNEAFVLHVMEDTGTDIKQITFNQSHDLYPTLLDDGRIMFLRWDNYGNDKDRLSLYTTNPNGSAVSLEYGYNSQNTGSNDSEGVFAKPRELLDSRIQVNLRPRSSSQLGGGMVAIDTLNFTENEVPIFGTGASGTAQSSIIDAEIITDGSPSPAGYYSSAYPIEDGSERLLVSWAPCVLRGYKLGIFVDDSLQLINDTGNFVDRSGNSTETAVTITEDEVGSVPCSDAALSLATVSPALPLYGLWIFDPITQTQSPVVLATEDTINTEAIVLQPIPIPNYIGDPVPGIDFERELGEESENVGIVHIRSVYDVDGVDITPEGITAMADPMQTPEAERPARFLRLIKAVSRASEDVVDFDNSAFGRADAMRDILGYVPIEPDGSAMFKVPADVAFTFSIVNADGKRVGPDGERGARHEYWMALRAGEVRECSGCHAAEVTATSHGRIGAEPESINLGALAEAPFPNTTLRDEFGTPNSAPQVGETMAQYYARINGPRTPSANIIDYSEWTEDGSIRPLEASINYSYSDLSTEAPTDCVINWNGLCRIVINYIDHIQPLWELPRTSADGSDITCVSCHMETGDMIASGERQLDLSSTQSEERDDYYTSYAQLLFGSIIQEEVCSRTTPGTFIISNQQEQLVVDGVPQFQMIQLEILDVRQYEAIDSTGATVPAPVDTTDPDLTLVLDEDGNPVPYMVQEMRDALDDSCMPILDAFGEPVQEPIPVMVDTENRNRAIMSSAGALASDNFFTVFEPGGAHEGYLNSAELKLIAEWLDIGGQYYNNPFEAP